MIRFILVVLYLILYLILFLPVLLVEWIIGKFNPGLKARSSKALVGWGFRCIAFLAGAKVTVKGLENIPTDTAVLYVGNHRSFFDVILTLSYFPGVTGYVAKLEMKKAPILRIWMKNIHCLFLDRLSTTDLHVVAEHVALLRAIAAGDAARADELAREHVLGFERAIRAVI